MVDHQRNQCCLSYIYNDFFEPSERKSVKCTILVLWLDRCNFQCHTDLLRATSSWFIFENQIRNTNGWLLNAWGRPFKNLNLRCYKLSHLIASQILRLHPTESNIILESALFKFKAIKNHKQNRYINRLLLVNYQIKNQKYN